MAMLPRGQKFDAGCAESTLRPNATMTDIVVPPGTCHSTNVATASKGPAAAGARQRIGTGRRTKGARVLRRRLARAEDVHLLHGRQPRWSRARDVRLGLRADAPGAGALLRRAL